MSEETDKIIAEFVKMLNGPTGDGKGKREAGLKDHWTVDKGHMEAGLRHLGRYWNGERADADSGCHPLVHLAWRCLAMAWQETHDVDEWNGQQFWEDVKGLYNDAARQYLNADLRPPPRKMESVIDTSLKFFPRYVEGVLV